jgi:putative acetyltransferase
MHCTVGKFLIRDWQPTDRQAAADVIATVLAEYGLGWEPDGADQDVLMVEEAYLQVGGVFWVVELAGEIVGTAAFYPIERGQNSVEIRKMYLRSSVRGEGLGRWLLTQLEATIDDRGYQEIWIETASVLKEAVTLYERSGYQPTIGVETLRCDRIYVKTRSPVSSSV